MRISDWSSDVCSSDLGVAEIVAKRQRFGQILVELEAARQPAGDLRHLDAMRQPGTIMVALGCAEDLGLVLESAKGRRKIGRASCREREWPYVWISVFAES